jgi:hypothetical protein
LNKKEKNALKITLGAEVETNRPESEMPDPSERKTHWYLQNLHCGARRVMKPRKHEHNGNYKEHIAHPMKKGRHLELTETQILKKKNLNANQNLSNRHSSSFENSRGAVGLRRFF